VNDRTQSGSVEHVVAGFVEARGRFLLARCKVAGTELDVEGGVAKLFEAADFSTEIGSEGPVPAESFGVTGVGVDAVVGRWLDRAESCHEIAAAEVGDARSGRGSVVGDQDSTTTDYQPA
jgi:hypothetical protein